jgi:hypothetical protein
MEDEMIGFGFAAGMTAAQKALRIGIAVALVLAVCALSYCQGRSDGKNGEISKQQAATIKAQAREQKAGVTADGERTKDQSANQNMTEGYHVEIAKAPPGGTNSGAATRLACERLRRAGRDLGGIPPCRGFAGAH